MDPDVYFGTLRSLRVHSTKLRRKEDAEEKRLVDFLPVNERMEIGKENKVLTRWQERQRDWEKIEQTIARKLNSKVARPLMMTTTDEYRSKMEEYDLIQAAIPLKDRFADSSWQMTLRGGGPISVAVGHIFSGLECDIDPNLPKPKMVRKPKPSTAVWKNDTFLDESENLIAKRKKYEKSIRDIRPHTMTYRDAGQLVIKTVDLFHWAEESSLLYVNQQREEELARLEEEMSARSQHSVHEQTEAPLPVNHPRLSFLSPIEVILDTVAGTKTQRSVSFQNTGSVVLYYRWKRHVVSAKPAETSNGNKNKPPKAKTLENILDDKGDDDVSLRSHVLNRHREKFYCFQNCGEILPNEVVTTTFVFDSSVGGAYRSQFVLQFIPEDTKISVMSGGSVESSHEPRNVTFEDQHSVHSHSSEHSVGGSQVLTGSITVTLHGHAVVPDETVTQRGLLAQNITFQTEVTDIQDIVYACIRRVRQPVRLHDLQNRQCTLFADRNQQLYDSYFAPDSVHAEGRRTVAPWLLTNKRIDALERLHHDVHNLYETIHHIFHETWAKIIDPSAASSEVVGLVPAPDLPSLDWTDYTVLQTEEAQSLRRELFPESTIEIFDEISEAELTPRWNFTVSSTLRTLDTLREASSFLAIMEKVLFERAKQNAKLEARAARRAAKKAAGDSDDEEDDEDEEPEEDDEEALKKQPPQHALAIETQRLRTAIEGQMLSLQTIVYPEDHAVSTTRNALISALDHIVDAQETALRASNLFELVQQQLGPTAAASEFPGFVNSNVLTPQLNPFTSSEGAEAFAQSLALNSPDPPVDPNEKPSKGAKGGGGGAKKGKEVALPPATPLQLAFYHKVFYETLRSSFLDTIVDSVSLPTTSSLAAEVTASSSSDVDLVEKEAYLLQSAVWRSDDLRDKVVVYTYDLSVAIDSPGTGSGFDLLGAQIERLGAELARLLMEGAPRCLLLLGAATTGNAVVTETRALELEQALQRHWAGLVARFQRVMRARKESIDEAHVARRGLQVIRDIPSWTHLQEQILPNIMESTQSFAAGAAIPIVLLSDLQRPELVPSPPIYVSPNEAEDDEDDGDFNVVVSVGSEEYNTLHHHQFEAAYPHRMAVQLNNGNSSSSTKLTKVTRQSQTKAAASSITCFCDVAAALVDLQQRLAKHSSVWIEGSSLSCVQPQLSLYRAHDASYKKRWLSTGRNVKTSWMLPADSVLSSQSLRERLLWASLPRLLPHFVSLVQTVEDADSRPSSAAVVGRYLTRLFPDAAAAQRRPRSVFVLGGCMRVEKLRLLDALIPLFDTIMLVGEFAVRFLGIGLSTPTTASPDEISAQAASFSVACRRLLAKARLSRCELVLPEDFLVGEEVVSRHNVQAKLFYHDPAVSAVLKQVQLPASDATAATSASQRLLQSEGGGGSGSGQVTRGDGIDYDGETKIASSAELVNLSQPLVLDLHSPPSVTPATPSSSAPQMTLQVGAVYDLGPVSQQRLESLIVESEVCYVYGVAGLVEVTAFQNGHNALVQALQRIFVTENAAAEQRLAQRKEALQRQTKVEAKQARLQQTLFTPLLSSQRVQHIALWGADTVEWIARSLDSDADFHGDLVASGHVSFQERNARLLETALLIQEPVPSTSEPDADVVAASGVQGGEGRRAQVRQRMEEVRKTGVQARDSVSGLLQRSLSLRVPQDDEFVYSVARNLDEEEDEEDEDEEDEDEDE